MPTSARFDRQNMYFSSVTEPEIKELFDLLLSKTSPKYQKEGIVYLEVPSQENKYNGFSLLKTKTKNRLEFKDPEMSKDLELLRTILHNREQENTYSLNSNTHYVNNLLENVASINPQIAQKMQLKYFQAVTQDKSVQDIAPNLLIQLNELINWTRHQNFYHKKNQPLNVREFNYTSLYFCENNFMLWNTSSQLLFTVVKEDNHSVIYAQESEYGFECEIKENEKFQRDDEVEKNGYSFYFLKHIQKPENVIGIIKDERLTLQDLKCFNFALDINAIFNILQKEKALGYKSGLKM